MAKQQPSPQQRRARSGRQTAQQKLSEYKKVLQDMHDLLLAENNLRELLSDEKRVPALMSGLSTILAWIKTVERKEEVINSFTNVLGKEIELFKENIENAILFLDVVLDILVKEKQALEKNQEELFAKWRIQAYTMLRECRKCIHRALLLFR